MKVLIKDPLLTIACGILWFLCVVMAIGAIACLVAVPAIIIMQDRIALELAKDMPAAPFPEFIGALCLVCVLAAVLVALLFRVFQLLRQMVDTVGLGDPFVPENARRLTRMAWLTLAVQVVGLPIGGLAMWIHEVTEGADGSDPQIGGIDGNGLLLMLILFILARVFRKGAEMRAELEGTV